MTVFIGGAWPYANGSLHIGHIAALLGGDILARYYRQKGEEVLYVSGSDCHGTPISIGAKQKNKSPKEIADHYHAEFKECFNKLGFSYDLYTRTDQPFHKKVVQEIFQTLLEKEYLYKQEVEQTYCEHCNQFLPDRYIEGICPYCGAEARGDQCERCCKILNPQELKNIKCKLCGKEPVVKSTEHFYFALSKLQEAIETYANNSKGWRENAVNLTKRYLQEGLQDRAVTRDLDWGIDVPVKGFEGKKIYVWIEAVSGYLSASKQWAQQEDQDWEKFWKGEVTAYYVHGKDNIPFHSIILPAILMGLEGHHLPDRIISSEYMTLEGRKISTSNHWAVWIPYILEHYNPDSIRYFLIANGPEKRDADFSWREFINSHNGELLGAFGNFVNRTLVFLQKSFENNVPSGRINEDIKQQIISLYKSVGKKIEDGEFKGALDEVFEGIRSANKYFDKQKPWIQVKEDIQACQDTLYSCVQIIGNLSNILSPFIPFSCEKIRRFLDTINETWEYIEIPPYQKINSLEILFERIDKKRIQEELEQIKAQ